MNEEGRSEGEAKLGLARGGQGKFEGGMMKEEVGSARISGALDYRNEDGGQLVALLS